MASKMVGKSAAGSDAKAGKLMPGSKNASSNLKSGGGVPKPSTTKHGSGFIKNPKTGK